MSGGDEKTSWLEPIPEEYANDGEMTGRRMFFAALTVIILAVFGGLIWYSYLDGNDNGPVPVVRADRSVVKEKPDNPGGLQVPDQDKRVFVRVDSEEPEKEQSLAPGAEIPVERETKPAPEVAKAEVAKQPEQYIQPLKAEQLPETTSKTTPKTTPKTNGKYLVQLGAFGQKKTAEQLWIKLQAKFPVILGGLGPDIMMIDLGKKGVFYRLRGGMIADRKLADQICVGLSAKKQPCMVVTK